MDRKGEVRAFLVSRRANVTPQAAGLRDFGGERRVPGLRREEVARLAGLSVDYYTQLERGDLGGASDSVLEAIARALQLDDIERAHLFDLARPVTMTPAAATVDGGADPTVRPSVQRVLDNLAVPALAWNTRHDILATNALGRALFSLHLEADRPNIARFIYLDPRAQQFYVDWPLARQMTAAMLRLAAGRNPLDEDLTALIGELSMRSPQFRQDWAVSDVHEHRTGTKTYRHPVVGEIDITFDVFDLPGEPDLSIITYAADEGGDSAEKLALLAIWAASQPGPGEPAS